MTIYNVEEAEAQLSLLFDAALAGEEVVLSKAGRPLVRLVPLAQPAARELGFLPLDVPDERFAPLADEDLADWL